MKHKKLLFFGILLIIIYTIYIFFHDERLNYLAIGDSLSLGVNSYGVVNYGYSDYVATHLDKNKLLKNYTKNFSSSGYRIADLKYQLANNEVLKTDDDSLSFKKCLREADLLTISIGGNDLISEINLSTSDVENMNEEEILHIMDDIIVSLKDLLKEIRKYATKDIFLLGLYNPKKNTTLPSDRIFAYFDSKMMEVCNSYDVEYISLYELFKERSDFLPNPTNIHPSTLGYEAIAKKIISKLEAEMKK